jgi:hypothetical protein
MQFITWLDYVLLPFYLGIIYLFAYGYRNRKYPPGHPWRRYFIPGLSVKIAGALFIGMLYQYYYGGGDTTHYFNHATIINSSFSESPAKWFNLIFHLPKWYDPDYTEYISQLFFYTTPNNYTVGAVAAFIGIFTFDTYLPTSVLFAVLSFTGVWAMFRTFAQQYPHILRHIALATLFIPSTFIWGSGIFKDTLCMFGLGWMVYGTFRMLVQREFAPRTIFVAFIGFYLVAIIKLYILVAFIPALLFWVLFSYSSKIRSAALRAIATVFVAAIGVGVLTLFSGKIGQELGQYSVENLAKTSTVTREYIYSVSGEEGSGYDIGDVDPSLGGMLQKLPAAVNVTLFRPYIWEARKAIVLLNALEAFLFLFVTLKILVSLGPLRVWRAIATDPNIQFCLIFTLIFAFAVGISSGNFGALSRYRIPCLPTFALALILIYYKYRDPERRLISLRR